MRPRALLAISFLLGVACSVERAGREESAPPDSGDGSPPAAVSPPVPVVPEVRAACAAAAAAWRAVSHATVRELDTLLTAEDVIEDPERDTLPPPGAVAGRWAACAVEGFAEMGLDSTQRRGLYWPAAGWVVFPRLNADGPGGQVQVYQRGAVRCQVAGEWDPGDDGDTSYVPDPFHREWTFCWRHGRLVAPQDTMMPGG